MKIVRVTYTTTEAYSAQNQEHIRTVMNELKALDNPGIFYNTCLKADGKTFIHTAFFNNVEDEQVLLTLPAFRHFQAQLKASGPEAPPVQDVLSLVGASRELF